MNFEKWLCGFAIASTFVGTCAHAGGEGVGGGAGIICNEYGVERVYLADTFELVRHGVLKGIDYLDPEPLFKAALDVLDERSPEKIYSNPLRPGQKVNLAWMLEHTRANLQFKYVHSLPDLSDDNIDPKTLPENCRKEQIAVQDVGKGIVREKFKVSGRMSGTERGLFELHETLVAQRNAPGADTTPIRQKIASILVDPEHSFQNMLKNLVFQKNIRDTQVPHKSLLRKFRDGKYCKLPTYLTTFSDLFWLGACNLADEWSRPPAPPAPVVRELPRSLQCQIMTEVNNDFSWHPPAEFQIHYVGGDNTPGDQRYALRFNGAAGAVYPNSSKVFSEGYPLPSEDKKQVFSISTSINWDKITVFLHKYVERTGEFVGGLQTGDTSKYTYFGISCVPAAGT